MVRKHPHAAMVESVENCVAKSFQTERHLNIWVRQYVNSAANLKCWKAFGANPISLALVYQWNRFIR